MDEKNLDDEKLDLCLVVNKYSPKNVEYPAIALSNGINSQLLMVKEKVSPIIIETLKDASIIKDLANKAKTIKYVADMSPDLINKIESGAVKLVQENGNLYAQLKNGSKYGTKIPIKKEVFQNTGLSASQIMNSMQLSAMQNQLKDIKNEMVIIGESVKHIYIGQQNDRIALYYSGIHLYIESQNIEDMNLKKLLMSQSIKSFSDGVCQLTLEMDENITHLRNQDYKKAKLKSGEKLMEYTSTINQCYAFIHQSYLMKASIYAECGEIKALAKTLNEYSLFLDNTVNKNIKLLKEYDIRDNGAEHGLWSNRSSLIGNIKKITNAIEESNSVDLLLEGDSIEEI